MTQLEKGNELHDIFTHKYALTDKIDYNVRLLMKYERAIGEEKDRDTRLKLKRKATEGRKRISFQKTERAKLSSNLIARQLGINIHTVKREYRLFAGVSL